MEQLSAFSCFKKMDKDLKEMFYSVNKSRKEVLVDFEVFVFFKSCKTHLEPCWRWRP